MHFRGRERQDALYISHRIATLRDRSRHRSRPGKGGRERDSRRIVERCESEFMRRTRTSVSTTESGARHWPMAREITVTFFGHDRPKVWIDVDGSTAVRAQCLVRYAPGTNLIEWHPGGSSLARRGRPRRSRLRRSRPSGTADVIPLPQRVTRYRRWGLDRQRRVVTRYGRAGSQPARALPPFGPSSGAPTMLGDIGADDQLGQVESKPTTVVVHDVGHLPARGTAVQRDLGAPGHRGRRRRQQPVVLLVGRPRTRRRRRRTPALYLRRGSRTRGRELEHLVT
jgi:hypothetical protein